MFFKTTMANQLHDDVATMHIRETVQTVDKYVKAASRETSISLHNHKAMYIPTTITIQQNELRVRRWLGNADQIERIIRITKKKHLLAIIVTI